MQTAVNSALDFQVEDPVDKGTTRSSSGAFKYSSHKFIDIRDQDAWKGSSEDWTKVNI